MIKKIASVVAGGMLMGATIVGAIATDLSEYPAPFVNGCSFSGAIVVGENAAAEDVVGAIDIASSLAVSGTSTEVGESSISVSGEAVKIETSSNQLNIGESLTDVKSVALDDDDLPGILSEGIFSADDGDDFEYKQKLTLSSNLEFSHWADSDYEDKEPTLGIKVPKNQLVATYKLDFVKSAESDVEDGQLDDLKDSSIEIMGNTYDIVEATNATNIKLELMGGAIKDVMEQGEVKTFTINDKEYEVEVTYIGGNDDSKVKFKVNGELTKSLGEGDTYKLSDKTQMGVREILEEEAGEVQADQVEFYIGAEKLTLENSNEMQINDEDIDNIDVTIDATSDSTAKINYIEIVWIAEDDLFVTEDVSILMPGLKSFKISYEGLTRDAEEVLEIGNDGDDVVGLTVELNDGKTTIDLLGSNGAGNFTRIGGDETDEGLSTVAYTINYDSFIYNLTDGGEHQYFIATHISDTDSYGESYLLKIEDVDEDGVDIENVLTGDSVEENLKVGEPFEVGSVEMKLEDFTENVFVNISDNNQNTTYFDRIVTREGLLINLPTSVPDGDYNLVIVEENANEVIGAGEIINVTLGHTTDNEVEVKGITDLTKGRLSNGNYYEIEDSDEYIGYMVSDLGTKIIVDKGPDQKTATITYSGEESYGNVFVSETEAGFGVDEESSESVCKVDIPSAKLDSEVSVISAQNLIVVGGPCANAISAEVMGVSMDWPECGEGFEEGKAMVKMYPSGDNVAMVIAGMTAMDTRRATRVLKDYKDYGLSGDEILVLGTTLTDIDVEVVNSS